MFDTCSFKPTNDGFPPSSGGGGGAVTSVFGRTGVVVAVAGDYNSTQITNSSSVSGAFVTDALNWLDTNKMGNTLADTQIFVGNGSNVATAVAMSGDATISNTGAVTLANSGVTQATYGSATQVPVFAVDSKGRITSVTNTAITGFVPTSLTSANIIVGNASNVATAVAMSGDIGISNTGATTIQNDAVTTNKILNSNVTYAKIQDATTNNILLGRATAGSGVLEEITLGTNLSFTGTTLNAAGGGGYNLFTYSYGNVTATINKSDLGGGNFIIFDHTGNGTANLTLGTGFSANDFFVFNFPVQTISLNAITNLTIDTLTTSYRGSSIFLIYNGTNWLIQQYIGELLPAQFNTGQIIIGNGAKIQGDNNASHIAIGRNAISNSGAGISIGSSATSFGGVTIGTGASSDNSTSVSIGRSAIQSGSNSVTIGGSSQGTGNNSTRIGANINTGLHTGVVAIGQGITSTNIDAVVIGRAASAGGTANVTIGGSATGTGANCVRVGNGVSTGSSNGVVAIGQGIINTASNSVAIGKTSHSSGISSVAIGETSVSQGIAAVTIGWNCFALGDYSNTIGQGGRDNSKARVFAKGAYAYARHYGAESRRIDTNTSTTDATNPSRHSDNTAWIGSTNASTLSMVLFAQSGENLTVQNGELLHFMVMISAKKEGATDSRVMIMNGAAVASGGTATIVGQGLIGTSDFNNSAGAAALVATIGATSNYITMTVDSTDGAATGTWQWTANLINITRTRTA